MHLKNFEEFFSSRLNFVIETSLNHIELSVLLERIVGHDSNLRFNELSEMIETIFGEVRSDSLVLFNANRTAQRQLNLLFDSCGQGKTTGILFRYRQCNKCNKYLDEEVRDINKKRELMMSARRGTFISSSIAGFNPFLNGGDSDEGLD